MPTEVRVLGATALFTAALVLVAWWLGQHHDAFVHQVHDVETVFVAELPAFSWSEPSRARPAMPPDAGFGAPFDAGVAMEGAEAELAAILIPAICNRRRNACGCTEYPSRFAPEEERAGATTCEQDTLRDFRSWWRNNIDMPVVVVGEPELSRLLDVQVGCSDARIDLVDFLRQDAVAGDACGTDSGDGLTDECRDESLCYDGRCLRYQRAGEPCMRWRWGLLDWSTEEEAAWDAIEAIEDDDAREEATARAHCAHGFHCVNARCEVDPGQASVRECPFGTFALKREAAPAVCAPSPLACAHENDCGDGFCAGDTAERRCNEPSPYRSDPGDHDRVFCARDMWCARGFSCVRGASGPECVPVVGAGERCEHAHCFDRCETVVPGGGQCIARACMTSHPFGAVGPS